MMPQLSTPCKEPRGDTLRPVLIVAVLGLTMGGAMGFGIGWWLGALTPDGSVPSQGMELRSAAWCGLIWALAISVTAALTAYKATVLDAALRRRPWSPRLPSALSLAEHFRPASAAPQPGVRLAPDEVQAAQAVK
jgi:hypothetical protein